MKILLLAMPDTGDWLDHVMRLPNLALTSLAGSIEGHDIRQLTEGDSVDEAPSWVPGDTRRIVFQWQNPVE